MPRDESKEKRAAKEVAAAPKAAAPVKPGKAVPEAVAEVKVEKKKEKIPQKERPRSKKKHTKVQIWKLYQAKGNELSRKSENCPRCGPGTFLAAYKNRKYCGKCGFGVIEKEVRA